MNVWRTVSRFRTTLAMIVIGAATALLPASLAVAQDKPIKVGLTTDLTGIAAAYAR